MNSDKLANRLFGLVSLSVVILLLLIFFFLLKQANFTFSLNYLTAFFNSDGWYPLEGKLGLLPMLYATLAAALGALLLAVPFGLAVAIYSEFLASSFAAKCMNLLIAIFASIPSVVFGLWGLTVIVPLINQWQAPGTSLLAAIFILALMILPTITITARSALAAIPQSLHEAASSLALSRFTSVVKIFLPAARVGIRQGILLAVVRALGETMALLMVAGNVVQIPSSVFDPIRVLTANIALEMAYATEQHRAALFTSGLVLMLLVCIILWFAQPGEKKHER